MTDTTNHERWNEDVAAYMLGALEPGEAAELERHLEGCERCREQVRWLTPAVQALPETAERLEPPRELRSRLLGEVRADVRRADAEARSGSSGGGRLAEWFRGLGSIGLRPIAGASILALLVVAVVGYSVNGGIGGGGSEAGGGSSTFISGQAPGITAEVVSEGGGGTLSLANVHQLPSDKVLEAWVRRDGEVEPVQALFVPDRAGRASTTIPDMNGVEVVMVTAEPKGGSDYPTSTPLASVPVQE